MWRHNPLSALAQVKTYFECAKPLPEPMLTNHQWQFVSSGLLGLGFVFVWSGVQLFSSFSVTIWVHYALSRTLECHCNAVQFITILHTVLRSQQQNVNQTSNSHKRHPRGWAMGCHNGCDGIPNHEPHDYLLKRLFRRRSKKTLKLRVTGLWAVNSPHKWPTTRKMFPFHDVIMILPFVSLQHSDRTQRDV